MSSSTAATCVYGGYVISVGLNNSKQARFFGVADVCVFFSARQTHARLLRK